MNEYYNNSICNDCEREAFCPEPCNAFLDDIDRFNKEQEQDKENETENLLALSCDCDCIENFLQYDVTDSEFLDVLNDDMDIMNMIDMSALLSYMSKINEIYCEANNLCTQCHSKLIEVKEPRGEYFGEPALERIIVCPHCG